MKMFPGLVILIGCPASGKSTLTKRLVEHDARYHSVSTDQIRAQLFGNAAIQGNWQDIEAEVLRQIGQHIAVGHQVIYDATNAKRAWRLELFQKLKQFDAMPILGLHLKTPLEVCKHWNQQRKRQVPDAVIEDDYQALAQFPPLPAEGFTAVFDIPFHKGSLDLSHLDNYWHCPLTENRLHFSI
jgi:predicted kinase